MRIRPGKKILATAAVIAAAVAGCGGSSSPTTTPLDVATFVQRYCALFAPCCTDVGVTQGSGCETVVGNNARLVGRVGQYGETCLTELKAKFDGYGYCNFWFSAVASCDKVLGQVGNVPGGNVQPGGECTSTTDCAPSTRGDVQCVFADPPGTSLVMRCQEMIKGAAGDGPCLLTEEAEGGGFLNGDFLASGYSCAISAGLYCDPGTDTCVAARPAGESCDSALPYACASNYCSNGVCGAIVPIGAGCMDAACAAGAYCAFTPSPICTAKVPFGGTCDSPAACFIGSCDNAVCKPPWDAGSLGFLCD